MAIIKCEAAKHFYDGIKYNACPFCSGDIKLDMSALGMVMQDTIKNDVTETKKDTLSVTVMR